MPEEGPQILVAFIPLLIAVFVTIISQWWVRRMAVRHDELGKAVVPLLWPFVMTHKWEAAPAFRREYDPFIRKSLFVTWVLAGLFVILMLRAAY